MATDTERTAMLARVFSEGCDARLRGDPPDPPYEIAGLVTTWRAGWNDVHISWGRWALWPVRPLPPIRYPRVTDATTNGKAPAPGRP